MRCCQCLWGGPTTAYRSEASEVPQQSGGIPHEFTPNRFDRRSDGTGQDAEEDQLAAEWLDVPTPGEREGVDVAAVLDQLDRGRDKELICISGSFCSDDLNGYSIFDGVPTATKMALIKCSLGTSALERAMGSMCGMAVGDALGHPFEFMPAQDEPRESRFDLRELKFYGESNSFRLHRGQWTDDAAMGLCIADSIIMRRAFDGSDMRVRFWCWWNRGMNNAFRHDRTRSSSVGLGGNIAKSLYDVSRHKSVDSVSPTFDVGGEDAGNGSLMRFTPIALYLHSASWDDLYYYARMSSYTTHPGIIAAEACSFLAHLIVKALRLPRDHDGNAQRFLDEAAAEYLECSGLSKKSGWGYDQMKWLVTSRPQNDTERCWNWRSKTIDISGTLSARGRSYNGYPVSAGYFGSYSLDGMALALWSVYNTTSFDEAVTRSVNLLGDADSHGSITGQIAGAFYGYRSIHPQFIRWLSQWDDHEFAARAVLLHRLGCAERRD